MPAHNAFGRLITRLREGAIARQVATPAPAPPTSSRLVEAARASLATAAQVAVPAPVSLIDRVRVAAIARTTRPEALPATKQREQRDSSVSASQAVSVFQQEMRELRKEVDTLTRQRATFNEQLLLNQRKLFRRSHPVAFREFTISVGAPSTTNLFRVEVDGVFLHRILWSQNGATRITWDINNARTGRVELIIRTDGNADRNRPLEFGEIGIEIPRGSDLRGTTGGALNYNGQFQFSGMVPGLQ